MNVRNKRNFQKKRKSGYWKPSPQSEYFGQRSKIVTATTSKGPKKMKLKNALKQNYKFEF